MNLLDFIVIGIMALCIIYCYVRGFAITVLNFFSFIISITLTINIYPIVSKFLRETGSIYENIKLSVAETLHLSESIATAGQKAEQDFIQALHLPEFVKQYLIENNNNVIYEALNVNSLEEYIYTFIANAIINIISIVVVFIIVFVLMKVIAALLDILTKLPLINTVNKLFGAALGAIIGIFFVWITLTVLMWVYGGSTAFPVNDLLDQSIAAKFLQQYNFISKFVTKI